METGIVVDNFDPTYSGKCRIRVFGRHTEKVCGQYVILDDDLPWALPASTAGTSSGYFMTPQVGEKVYVECVDGYNFRYHGQVASKSDVKRLLVQNAEDCQNVKVLLYTGEPDENGEGDYVKIYYVPERGLTIESGGNKLLMPKYGDMELTTKNGVGISINDSSNDINIHTDGNVNLDCDKIHLGKDASERLILGDDLMRIFNTHTHYVPGGTSAPPAVKITPGDFSKNIKIS